MGMIIEDEEILTMITEEDDGAPFLEMELETSLPLHHKSKTTSKTQSPSIIKPNPHHFRGKDLNRVFQNYIHGLPSHPSDKSCPSIQRMEVCMGRQFYPIYPIPEENEMVSD